MRITVVGGLNVDISGTAETALLHGDSNPGVVTRALGGVGRNIAENLARLGAQVELVTALGTDAHTAEICSACQAQGIGLDGAEIFPDVPNGTYLCLNDENGDLFAAVSDMRACRRMTPDWLAQRLPLLNSADLVVLDANLPAESLRYLAVQVRVPLAADPVSIKKAGRLKPILSALTLIKPNRPEASLLTGQAIHGLEGVEAAGAALLREGVRHVLISLGSQGVWYADRQRTGIQPCLPAEILNTNGCGDALFAAACLAIAEGQDIAAAARLGQAAAAICAEENGAVSPHLSRRAAECRAGGGHS